MKKILYITNGVSGPGGLERVLSIKASYLTEYYNYEIYIITLNQRESSLFYEFNSKINFVDITTKKKGIAYLNEYWNTLKKCIKKIKPNIISVCDDGIKGLMLPIIIGKPCPMIYERHVSKNIEVKNDNLSFKNKIITRLKFKLMDFGANYYDSFIVLTKGNLQEWNIKNKIVIPNPLSFYPEKDNCSTLQNKKIMAVGKQSFQKGYDRLLQSWAIINEEFSDWKLEIYGTIDENSGLEELSKKLGLQSSVYFFPPVKNIAEKYKEASIYVMSSRYEGFGMVLTEAMAYGVPCISFNCPFGPSDIITHEKNGLLVTNNDIEKFAFEIKKLIINQDQRKVLGENARQAVQIYLPESIAKQWNDLFQNLMKQN